MKTGALTFVGLLALAAMALGAGPFTGQMPADYTLMRDTYHLAVICERFGYWLGEGHFAAWMPEFAGGHPVHALWMYGFAHPASLLWALLPIEAAYTWGALLHAAFGGAGIAAYLRYRGVRADAAFAAGALFVLSEFVLVKIGTGGVNQLWALAWAPWVLRAIERAVAGERGATCALGLWSGAALLAGHVQVWIFVGPILVLHAIVAASGSRSSSAAFGRIALGGVLAAGISAVQWLPTLELVEAAGDRPVVDSALLLQWSAPPLAILGKLVPGGLGARGSDHAYWGGQEFEHEHAGMTGVWVLLLALVAIRRRDARRALWGAAAVFGLVAAVGFHTQITGWINSLPLIGWSRTPARAQMLTVLGGAILAGHGLSDWIEGGLSRRRRGVALGTAVVVLLVSAVVLVGEARGASGAFPGAAQLVTRASVVSLLGLVAVGVALQGRTARLADERGRAVGAAIVVVIAAFVAAPPVAFTDTGFLHVDWRAQLPPGADTHRVHLADFRLPYVERQGLRTYRRPAHVEPATTRAFQQRMSPAAAAWMDVGVTAIHPGVERGPPHGLVSAVRFVAPPQPPRGPARLFRGATVEESDARALDRLAGGEDTLLVAGGGESTPVVTGPGLGRVEPIATGSPDSLAFDVRCGLGTWLFLSEKWYPGWTAEVDGAAVPIRRANVAFRALPVPSGTHRVTLRYEPQSFRYGRLATLVAGLIALVGCGLALRRPPEAP